tara:strand:- start:640 stop:1005 length:366 start_codon:yes stop_codon:yes gene_type:complete
MKMSQLESYKQISAILPDDDALIRKIVQGLKQDKGLLTLNHYTCRGLGAIGRRGAVKRFRAPSPKSLRMLSVLVKPEQADDIFAFIFEIAEMDRPMGGILFMGPLEGGTLFTMPEGISDED